MSKKKDQHSVFNEPHLRPGPKAADPSETRAERTLRQARESDATYRDGKSVYDEPDIFPGRAPEIIDQDWSCSQCGYNLRGLPAHHPCPECGHRELYRPAPTSVTGYRTWLAERCARTPARRAWLTALLLALAGGPWALLVAGFGTGAAAPGGASMLVLALVFGPAMEEVMKIATAAWVVETRPYLFQRIEQIQAATIGAAVVFAAVENVLYTKIYVANASTFLVLWRWTVCVALHVGCTLIATRGLIAVWQRTMTECRPPRLAVGLRWLVIAIVVHGCYNGVATAFELLNIW